MGTLKSIFWIIMICILLWIAYFVYQTYVWLGNILSPTSDLPADETSQLKDYIKMLNDFLKQMFDIFKKK